MTTPEQDLWVAVIAQQFTDACREIPIEYYYEQDGHGLLIKLLLLEYK